MRKIFLVMFLFSLMLFGRDYPYMRDSTVVYSPNIFVFVDSIKGDTVYMGPEGFKSFFIRGDSVKLNQFLKLMGNEDTVYIGTEFIKSPYGLFVDSLYSPFIYVDSIINVRLSSKFINVVKADTTSIVEDSLRGYWKFEEGSGDSIHNIRDDTFHLTKGSWDFWSEDNWSNKSDYSMELQGPSSGIFEWSWHMNNYDGAANLYFPFSISFMVKWCGEYPLSIYSDRAQPSSDIRGFHVYINNGDSSIIAEYGYKMGGFPNWCKWKKKRFTIPNIIPINQWCNIVTIWDDTDSNHVEIYLNGERVDSATILEITNSGMVCDIDTMIHCDNGNMFVGKQSAGDDCFDYIDELMIYNKALTPEEIQKNYDYFSSLSYGGLLTVDRMISADSLTANFADLDTIKLTNKWKFYGDESIIGGHKALYWIFGNDTLIYIIHGSTRDLSWNLPGNGWKVKNLSGLTIMEVREDQWTPAENSHLGFAGGSFDYAFLDTVEGGNNTGGTVVFPHIVKSDEAHLAPYGSFTDSLYSPYARPDTTLLTGIVKAYAYTSFGQNTMATVIGGDTFYFTRMQNADWRWYFPDANLYFETTAGKVWLMDDASIYSETYPVLGTPANKFKSSCIDTLHALKADIDTITSDSIHATAVYADTFYGGLPAAGDWRLDSLSVNADTIVKFEEADSHLYITMADGSVYQCVDTTAKWVSEARVDTFTFASMLCSPSWDANKGYTDSYQSNNRVAPFANLTAGGYTGLVRLGMVGDSIYIDSITFYAKHYGVSGNDSINYSLGRVASIIYDTVLVDTMLIDPHIAVGVYQSIVSPVGMGGKSTGWVAMCHWWLKHTVTSVRFHGAIVYYDALYKLRH